MKSEFHLALGRLPWHNGIWSGEELGEWPGPWPLGRSLAGIWAAPLCQHLPVDFWGVLVKLLLLFSCSVVSDSVTPWTAARQASLSFTNSRRSLKPMSIESVMPSNHLIVFSSSLQSFPASGSFQMSQLFPSGGQSIGASSFSISPSNEHQDWSPLGGTGWISLRSRASRESSRRPHVSMSQQQWWRS